MKQLFIALGLCALSVAPMGCKAKPSEEACAGAIANVRKLTGLDKSDIGADPKAAIRSCRANSSKETVDCVRNAKSLEELEKCEGELGEQYFAEEEERERKRHEQEAKEKQKEEEEKDGE